MTGDWFGQVGRNHRRHMSAAIKLARRAFENGFIPVGALLVRDEIVLAKGISESTNFMDAMKHAEQQCLSKVAHEDLSRATFYTTLSPCGPCTSALIAHGVGRVVIGDVKLYRGGLDALSAQGVRVEVLDDKRCQDLLYDYVASNRDLWGQDIRSVLQEAETRSHAHTG